MDLDPVLGTKSLGSPKKKRCKKAREKKVNKGKKLSLASEKPNFSAEMVEQTSQTEVKNISTDAKAQKRPRCTNVSSKDSAAFTGTGLDSTIALDSVFKIQAPSSLCVSGARETKRKIEDQTEVTLQLQQQILQHLSARGSVELNLREPNEQKIPVPIAANKEPGAQQDDFEFPELTKEMQREIHEALFGGSQDQTISDGFRLSVTRRDILTLNGLNWLNDEVINFYMNMLMERSKQKGFPNVHAFSTFFYPLLKSAGYQSIKRWTKKLDIFTMDILLVPIHLGVHWCLAVIDLRKKSITLYDSMAGLNNDVCRILMQYLKQESLDKKGLELDSNGWQLTSKKSQEIPQQNNGSDCGMFSCKYADYISQDKEITFTQNPGAASPNQPISAKKPTSNTAVLRAWCNRLIYIITCRTSEREWSGKLSTRSYFEFPSLGLPSSPRPVIIEEHGPRYVYFSNVN